VPPTSCLRPPWVFHRWRDRYGNRNIMLLLYAYNYYYYVIMIYGNMRFLKNRAMIGIVENENNYFICIPNSMQNLTLLIRGALAHFIKLYMLIICIKLKYIKPKLTQNPWLEATRSTDLTTTRSRNCRMRVTKTYKLFILEFKKKMYVELLYKLFMII